MKDNEYNVKYQSITWKKETIIKDAVHGYISIPKPIMREIIDTETFQRLKNIEQTGMEALYPSATHNRFTHSLGVYHLSKMAFQQFRKNVKADFKPIYDEIKNRYAVSADSVWDRWMFLFELASLLHDCGHAPFSHTLEFIYDLPVERTLNLRLTEDMNEEFTEDIGYKDFLEKGDKSKVCGAPHERMSAFFIKETGQGFFNDRVKRLLYDYAYEFFGENNIYIKDKGAFDDDIEFMIRMIIGCRYDLKKARKYHSYKSYDNKECWNTELQLRNCVINMLNSKLDVDNLDYVIRDSKYSGYANQSVDVERLLSSLTIVTAFDLYDVELDEDDKLDCCVNLRKFEGNYVNARISGACHLRSHSQDIKAHGKVCLAGKECGPEVIQRSLRTGKRFSAQVTFPFDKSEGTISISALDESEKNATTCYLNIRGTMHGKFTGTILTNEINISKKWKEKGRGRLFSAYYQNSMSVLMGAIDGSNFEKKWIYAHQISTFTNNYLNIYLLEKYAQILMNKELKEYNLELKSLNDRFGHHLTAVADGQHKADKGDKDMQTEQLKSKIMSNFLEENSAVVALLDGSAGIDYITTLSQLTDHMWSLKKILNIC